MPSDDQVRFVELTDLPPVEPNSQQIEFVHLNERVLVIYQVNPWLTAPEPGGEADPSFAVIDLGFCFSLAIGPNDEAQGNHPMARYGWKFYAISELINSPWIEEQARIQDKDQRVDRWLRLGLRHIVFAFKEGMLECLCRGYQLVGTYATYELAVTAATERAIGPEARAS